MKINKNTEGETEVSSSRGTSTVRNDASVGDKLTFNWLILDRPLLERTVDVLIDVEGSLPSLSLDGKGRKVPTKPIDLLGLNSAYQLLEQIDETGALWPAFLGRGKRCCHNVGACLDPLLKKYIENGEIATKKSNEAAISALTPKKHRREFVQSGEMDSPDFMLCSCGEGTGLDPKIMEEAVIIDKIKFEIYKARVLVVEMLDLYRRAKDGFLATIGILKIYFPKIRKVKWPALRTSLTEFYIKCFRYAMEDILEKKLKQDLQSLLALGTKKFLSRSLNCFGGMLKSLIMGETVNMWKKGKKGQYAASFVRSLYESKRCWFKMSNALLRENEQKHCHMLCGEKKEIDEIAKSYIEKATDYIFPSEEMEKAREVLNGGKPMRRLGGYKPGACVPTFKSSYDTPRHFGGNHGELLMASRIITNGKGEKEIVDEELKDVNKFLEEFKTDKEVQMKNAYKMNVDIGLTGPADSEEIGLQLRDRCFGSLGKVNSSVETTPEFSNTTFANTVKYVGLQEAGKIRGITIGEAKPYTGLRPFQKFLIQRWKQMKFGTMIPDVKSRILKLKKFQGPNGVYFSGDYSNATDNLSIDATLTCINRIIKNMDLEGTAEAELLRITFGGALIKYPTMRDPFNSTHAGTEFFQQKRGQFMGHPVSFVLLCIINLSTYLRTMADIDDFGELKNPRKVLINGDDILFVSDDPRSGDFWRYNAEAVGLEVNEQKTYVSPRWALINSIFVDMDSDTEIRYVPLAAALGKNPKGEPCETLDQAPALWELCLAAPTPNAVKVCCKLLKARLTALIPISFTRVKYSHNRFKKRREVKILEKSKYPNFFIRRDLGGLGMRPVGPFQITPIQRKVAGYFSAHRDKMFLREKISELPPSAALAIKKFHIVRGPSKDFTDEKGRPLFGPLRRGEAYEDYQEELLTRCLISTQFCFGPPTRVDYIANARFYHKALKDKSATHMKEDKIRNYLPALQVVENYSPTIPWIRFKHSWFDPGGILLDQTAKETLTKNYDFSKFEEEEISNDTDDLPYGNDAPESSLQQNPNNKTGPIQNNQEDRYVERISLHRARHTRDSHLSKFQTQYFGTQATDREHAYISEEDCNDLNFMDWGESSDAV